MTDSYKYILISMLTSLSLQASFAYSADQALESLPAKKNTSLSSGNFKGRSINAHELSVGDIQNIQSIGRSVLAAKHSQPVDLNAQALKQNIETLHQKLVDLIASDVEPVDVSDEKNVLNITIPTKDGKPQVLNQQSVVAEAIVSNARHKEQKAHQYQAMEQQVTQQTGQIRQQLNDLKSRHQTGLTPNSLDLNAISANGEPNSNVHRLDTDVLSDKTEQLLTEVDQALAYNGEDRTQKLAALRERLTTKNLSEAQVKTESVPTISTITHHRP